MSDHISKAMINGLVALVRGTTDNLAKGTLNALIRRNLLDVNGRPTESGRAIAISSMPLLEQCQRIGISFKEINIHDRERPEMRALEYFQMDGWNGAACEGGTILTLLKSASLPALIRLMRRWSYFGIQLEAEEAESWAISRYFEAQLTEENAEEVAEEILHVTPPKIRDAFDKIYHGYIVGQYFGLSADFMVELFEALGKDVLRDLVIAIGKDSYTYRKGWPDLTLVRNSEVRFVEIKTQDRLIYSQLETIPYVAEILGHERFSVLRLK